MSDAATRAADDLLALYDSAVDEVYGYVLYRCGHVETAQDLTSETFLAAAQSVRSGSIGIEVSVPWLIGVARHKLVDHWRRRGREERAFEALDTPGSVDPWVTPWDEQRALAVLQELSPRQRAALTLRYVDDLSVREVATLLGATEHATESLLARARAGFRRAYEREEVE